MNEVENGSGRKKTGVTNAAPVKSTDKGDSTFVSRGTRRFDDESDYDATFEPKYSSSWLR